MTKGKIILGKAIANTLGAAHFVAQTTADVILKTEVESIARLFDCKDSRVDIALARKHATRKTQNKIKNTVKKKSAAFLEIRDISVEKMNKMYNYKTV